MKDPISRELRQLEQLLVAKYGVVMEHHQVADLLHTSSASLRNMMRRSKKAAIRYLLHYKRRPGRKILYLSARVAEALVLGDRELERRMQGPAGGGSNHD